MTKQYKNSIVTISSENIENVHELAILTKKNQSSLNVVPGQSILRQKN